VAENLYDEVLYTTHPRIELHPDRLAAAAKLLGMTAAPVDRCRVLEIGCGDGSHLISLAFYLPGSRFTGVDLAGEPIRAGRRIVDALGLANISLEAIDLREIGAGHGEFDFILVHGLYSWLPPETRDDLLRICRERLAPNGVAYVSYNAYPGYHFRQIVRDMMLYHTRHIGEPAARVAEARRFVQWLRDSNSLGERWRDLIGNEVHNVLDKAESAMFHDDLAEVNDPVYFHEFAAHAARHGLQFLTEVDLSEMFDPLQRVQGIAGSVVEREQYMDFLRLRRFRRSLLCRAEIQLDRDVGPARMFEFSFSAPRYVIVDDRMENKRGARIAVKHEAVARVVGALGDSYPLPLPFEELVPYAGDAGSLSDILFGLLMGGFLNLHVHDYPCQETVSERPVAFAFIRYQAAQGFPIVTTVCNAPVEVDDVSRRLLPLLDGTRHRTQLIEAMAAAGVEEAARCVDQYLESYAHMGALER
jgi:methyltransferase-like protein/SAM-dependent methyltransferase